MIAVILRLIFFLLSGILVLLGVLLVSAVKPSDRTPAHELPEYDTMMARLDTLQVGVSSTEGKLVVGFGKVNITPSRAISTAGYGKRMGKPYERVLDSIYVRAMVIGNGARRVAIVSADLLIIPPTVTQALKQKLPAAGFSLDNTYLGAVHSHNSIGHWGEGATRFIYGAYEDSVVQFIADGIVASIRMAAADLVPSSLRSGAVAIPEAVKNRLIDDGPEDPYLRILEVTRDDSATAVMVSFAAHATCLSQATNELSRDYPGRVVDMLESRGYSFAMFIAGGVGSHKGSAPEKNGDCMDWMAEKVTDGLITGRGNLEAMESKSVGMARVPLSLGDPQVKISEDWSVRPWLFRASFGEYAAFLTVLRVGDLVMLGTPCDFSGEFSAAIDSAAAKHDVRAMVTSFNGGYIGYVTPVEYYDIDHYETRLMNWYAPGTGEYIRRSLEQLLDAATGTR